MEQYSQKRTENQAASYANVIFTIVQTVFTAGGAADRELRKLFRTNKKFGASDRRFISETVFSLFRWWGWLHRLLRSEKELWIRKPEEVEHNKDWLQILVFSQILEASALHPAVVFWKNFLARNRYGPRFLECLVDRSLEEQAEGLQKLMKTSKLNPIELIPAWLIEHVGHRKVQKIDYLQRLQKRPPLWIRAQPRYLASLAKNLKQAGLTVQQSSAVRNAFCVVNRRVNLYDLKEFRQGHFEIQDLASQVIGLTCGAKPGERWWDVCAGAGGKSLQLASMMQGKGTVVATDIRSWKLRDLKKRAKRAQLHNITTRDWQGRGIPSRAPNFDGVLADVPCSGTGTWRRNPDARWTFRESQLRELSELQFEILSNAAKAVKPGGLLVYGTCSVCRCENEEVITKFLSENHEYFLEDHPHPLTGKMTNGQVHMSPTMADCDFTFTARMRRRKNASSPESVGRLQAN